MFSRTYKTGLLIAVFAALFGCSEPPVPPEVQLATSQDQDLWRTGASIYAPDEYQQYAAALAASREMFVREQAQAGWRRDYQPATEALQAVLTQGEVLKIKIAAAKAAETAGLLTEQLALQKRIAVVRDLVDNARDKRLGMRKLVQAEVQLDESRRLARAGKSDAARKRLEAAEKDLDAVITVIRPLVQRYADRAQIGAWRRLADDAIDESRRNGGEMILVSKVDRQVTLFRNGTPVRRFTAGLGFNGLADKLYSGDRATPEGRYKIVKKISRSKNYRALLLDYPNSEDQLRFARAKRQGLVPKNCHIGNLIEIHGGGKNGLTYGCVALDDGEMSVLFDQVDVGTPVVIVGATEHDNFISSAIRRLN